MRAIGSGRASRVATKSTRIRIDEFVRLAMIVVTRFLFGTSFASSTKLFGYDIAKRFPLKSVSGTVGDTVAGVVVVARLVVVAAVVMRPLWAPGSAQPTAHVEPRSLGERLHSARRLRLVSSLVRGETGGRGPEPQTGSAAARACVISDSASRDVAFPAFRDNTRAGGSH